MERHDFEGVLQSINDYLLLTREGYKVMIRINVGFQSKICIEIQMVASSAEMNR